ncbi:hypothetical protein [Rhizobium sp. AP16]|uniref:hypothetical protein n=1 Tax=Rhizobium sp. AP16 TaxID=1144306 RepID=UPI00026ED265|nr:hypothetical protein [Rhizobium sp. AP16]EJK83562.1 hypothetical protein PMI03_03217 [Rhizobium sp. AP16]
MNLSRRQSLGLLAGAVIPPTVVVGAAPLVAVATKMTPQERYDFHLAELKKAAEEIEPMIGRWHVSGLAEGETGGCALIITAFRVTGRYQGDGLYERGKPNWNGVFTRYNVRLLDHRIDDERLFEVRGPGERMQLIESNLNTFIGRKVGALS